MIDLKTPVTFRDFLDIEGCGNKPDGPFGYTRWPCGLCLPTNLARQGAGANGDAVRWVHEEHHRLGHTEKMWTIQETVEQHEGTVTLHFRCQHQ